MASDNDPLQGLTIDQIDINDPETRKYVSQYVDMNDPETAKFFGTPAKPTGMEGAAVRNVQSIGGDDNVFAKAGRAAIEGGRRFNQLADESIDRQGGWGLSDETRKFFGAGGQFSDTRWQDLPVNILDGLYRAGIQTPQALAEALALGGDEIIDKTGLSDAIRGPGGEKFQPGHGLLALAEAFPAAGIESGIPTQALANVRYNKGVTPDEIIADFESRGQRITPDEANYAASYYNQGGTEASIVKNGASPEVNRIVDHVNTTTEKWTNAPEVDVYQSFKDLPDIDDNALGVFGPDGKVLLNAEAIAREAELRGMTENQMTNTVLFHEGLGHFGLAQKFRADLDGMLDTFTESSPEFRKAVDDWMAKNPDAYLDDISPMTRAAEEVLAEMSEAGKIPKSLLDQLKNYIKATARRMRFKVDYSMREIKTILAQSHDAVINGMREDVAGNGFKFKTESRRDFDPDMVKQVAARHGIPEERIPEALKQQDFRDQLLAEEIARDGGSFPTPENVVQRPVLDDINPAQPFDYDEWENKPKRFEEVGEDETGVKSINYKADSGESIPIRMAIDNGVAEISIDPFSTAKNRLGPAELRKAMLDLAEQYPEIEKFGGFRRSGAGAGRVQELTVREKQVAKSVNRYMRSQFNDSKSPVQQGRLANIEEGAEPTGKGALNRVRSNRNIEGILEEVAPTKTKESFEEWIDQAGKIKMSGQAAQNLALGTDSPQLLAAEKFLTRSANRITDLSRKISEGRGTERDAYLLEKELDRAENISQSISDVMANAARLMNARKIEVGTDKVAGDNFRRMLSSLTPEQLRDPETVKKVTAAAEKAGVRDVQLKRALATLTNAVNLPRSIMSSMDLSAPLRQGVFLIGRKQFWKGVPDMFKYAVSEGKYNAARINIEERPSYPLMKRVGLAVDDNFNDMSKREEAFISNWAEKIPVAGRFVKGSERAYTGFLRKLRADMFDDLVNRYRKAGVDITKDPAKARAVAKYVNAATGRGSLGSFEQSASTLANVFFSPRLIASRVELLNPTTYVKMDPVLRKEAIRDLVTFGGLATTVASLAAMAGAKVETDPRSSDFAKIRVGNTRYDILGGFGQYLTLGARIATNEKKNAKGEVQELGKGYGADSRKDVIETFLENKFSPVAGFLRDYLNGKNPVGEPFDVKQKAVESFIPLFFQDAAEVVKENGAVGIPMSVPGIFGVGMQTYDVDLGYDAFGRDIEKLQEKNEPETDPVALEVARLNDFNGKPVLAAAPKSFKFDKNTVELSPEDVDEWQRVMGYYQHEYLKEDTASPEYKAATDEEKVEIVKKAHSDAYKDTKAYMIDKLGLTQNGTNDN